MGSFSGERFVADNFKKLTNCVTALLVPIYYIIHHCSITYNKVFEAKLRVCILHNLSGGLCGAFYTLFNGINVVSR